MENDTELPKMSNITWMEAKEILVSKEKGKQTTVSCSHMYRTQIELHRFHFQDKEQ